MPGRLFEQFEVGQEFEHARSIDIDQESNAAFCRLTHNRQPLHLDADAARAAGFRDILVNGLLTFSAAVGVTVPDLTEGTLIANLGYDAVRHPAPVHPGDRLHVKSRVASRRTSSKPGRGIVTFETEVRNQEGTLVCQFQRTAMVRSEDA